MALRVSYKFLLDYIYPAVLTMVGVCLGSIATDSHLLGLEEDWKELSAAVKRTKEALEGMKSQVGTLEDKLSAIAKHVHAEEEAVRAHEGKKSA